MSTPHRRTRGEQGIAIIMTSLCLLPLMVFAAFGVDLASWYSRISYLQKAADAAALAGTVWMPEINEATEVACESLAKNGVSGAPDCGTGPFVVEVSEGSTATSLLVSVTDPSATRYFSQVFRGDQSLSRTAEAEYNLPLPLGSPLNYFGGDRSSVIATTPAPVTTYGVTWPTDYSTRRPTNPACNISLTDNQPDGRWSTGSPPTFNATAFSGTTVCTWGATPASTGSDSPTVPPDWEYRAPTNLPCNVFNGTLGANGRWESQYTYNAGARYSSAQAPNDRQCRWPTVIGSSASSMPAWNKGPTPPPSNRPCRVSHTASDGWWGPGASAGYDPVVANVPTSVTSTTIANGYRLCRWSAGISSSTTPSPPNNIPTDRDPGFWAMIYGPGQYAANGDAFSARCTTQFNCASVENEEYRELSDPNRGEWYVVDVPENVTGSVVIKVFDASYNHASPDRIMDSTEGVGTPEFETEYRVFKQTNPLDFNVRTPEFGVAASNDPVYGGCWWKLQKESGFYRDWKPLCTLTGVEEGDRYLINVRTNTLGAANEAGNNGYALEVVANNDRYAVPGPSIYAYGDMVLNNQNQCSVGLTCEGTFYLAKVDPKYAGKTLVIDLYDGGDSVGAGKSTVYPMMPDPLAPKPSLNVNDDECAYTATPAPNDYIDTSDLRIHTGSVRVEDLSPPDSGDGLCGIVATRSGVRQYNGEWMKIRVSIPPGYSCNMAINTPQTLANSCWWGIRYKFEGNAGDTTTWSASIEGNPVHLTS